MNVQPAPAGVARFVIRMSEHTELLAKVSGTFGNSRFKHVSDDPDQFIIANHDAGWAELNSESRLYPETGLPYNLTETPFKLIMFTSRRSPDFNKAHHSFSSLLSSMHSWGLYNGRYGPSHCFS